MQHRRIDARRPLRRHGRRMLYIQLGLVAALGLVVARIVFVQDAYGQRLSASATAVRAGQATLLAPRGSLLDAQGQPLAYDMPAFIFDVNRNVTSNKQQLASLLAKPLGVAQAQLLPYLQGSGWLQWPHPILQTAKNEIVAAIEQLKPGQNAGAYVTFTPTEQRFYPDGTMAANTIGWINSQGAGEAGLEAEYNKYLAGVDGSYTYTKEGNGEPIASSIHLTKHSQPGDNVQLNINGTIQSFVEQQMNQIVKQYHPEHATIIVMKPQTGAILAMSSSPSFNPNTYWTASSTALFNNWAVNASFEPGSTFKIFTLAAALASHTVNLNTIVPSGQMTVAGQTIHDWNWWGWSLEGPNRITVAQALEKSSNVGMGTVALKMGWPTLLYYMKNFGLLAPTGIDLPNESSSDVFPPSEQGPVQLATSGFGQGIAVTPLQQLSGLSAILNGGNVMKPEVAHAIIDPQTGKVVKRILPVVSHAHVIPPAVAQEVKNTMLLDVKPGGNGIDFAAYLPGYEVGGKTGTAQIVDRKTGRYYNNHYSVAFIGFAPGWDPQVEVYCNVYYPNSPAANTWGSTIAAPPARRVLQECMQVMHIAPRSGKSVNPAHPSQSSSSYTSYTKVPDVAGMSGQAAAQAITHAGLRADVIGQGTAAKQWPAYGVAVPKNSIVYVLPKTGGAGTLAMPNLTGASMREAGDILAAAGVKMKPLGTGFATTQSVPPGHRLTAGETVTVTFTEPASS